MLLHVPWIFITVLCWYYSWSLWKYTALHVHPKYTALALTICIFPHLSGDVMCVFRCSYTVYFRGQKLHFFSLICFRIIAEDSSSNMASATAIPEDGPADVGPRLPSNPRMHKIQSNISVASTYFDQKIDIPDTGDVCFASFSLNHFPYLSLFQPHLGDLAITCMFIRKMHSSVNVTSQCILKFWFCDPPVSICLVVLVHWLRSNVRIILNITEVSNEYWIYWLCLAYKLLKTMAHLHYRYKDRLKPVRSFDLWLPWH